LAGLGKWFAESIPASPPDIMTTAKAMGGGFPMGALLAREDVAANFVRGDHASTFGGSAWLVLRLLQVSMLSKKKNL